MHSSVALGFGWWPASLRACPALACTGATDSALQAVYSASWCLVLPHWLTLRLSPVQPVNLQVATAGLAALRAAGVELVPVSPAAAAPAGGRGTAPAPSRVQSVGASSGQLAVGTPAQAGSGAASVTPASNSGMSSMLPKSWQPKSWRSSSSNGGGGGSSSAGATTLLGSTGRQLATAQSLAAPAGSSGGSGPGSPNPSPSSGTYTRAPFVLRRTPDLGDSTHMHRSFSKESGKGRGIVGCVCVRCALS